MPRETRHRAGRGEAEQVGEAQAEEREAEKREAEGGGGAAGEEATKAAVEGRAAGAATAGSTTYTRYEPVAPHILDAALATVASHAPRLAAALLPF
jgi:hypothetical protein